MLYSVPVKNYLGQRDDVMDTNKAIEYLMHFGMSRQEATVYLRLIEAGKQTGYEIASDTGIARSNV